MDAARRAEDLADGGAGPPLRRRIRPGRPRRPGAQGPVRRIVPAAQALAEEQLAEAEVAEGATDGAGDAVRSAVRNMHRVWAHLHQARARLSEGGARGQAGLTASREADAALEQALAAEAEVSAAEHREDARREDPAQEPSGGADPWRAEHLDQVRRDEPIRSRLERQRRDQPGLRRFRPGPGRTLGGSPAISAVAPSPPELLDHEISAIQRVLAERGRCPARRSASGRRQVLGSRRLRPVPAEAVADGAVRRVGRDTYVAEPSD